MVRGRAAAVAVLAMLLLVPAMAGCLGSSGDTGSSGQDTTTGETPDSSDGEAQDDAGSTPGNSSEAPDANETETETVRETFTNQTTIVAQGSVIFNTPAIPPEDEASWRIFENRPDDLTGLLVEATVETPTQGTEIGQVSLELHANDGAASDTNETQDQPVRVRLSGDDYVSGEAQVMVSPPRFPTLWVDAQVTIYTTYWTGGEPDWSYSAV